MKKTILFPACLLLLASCVKEPASEDGTPRLPDVDHFLTADAFDVPTRSGYVTTVTQGNDTVAEAVSPMSVMLPRKSGAVNVTYTPLSEYPNEIENKAKLYQVVCFEDSKSGDYDYNDLVIHVKYQVRGDIFGFGVQPIALGSVKSIRLGCVVYKGTTQVFKGLITPEGKDCRAQYFESQDGFVNTTGNAINQKNGGWNTYLGSTIRNWNVSRLPGTGAMRVEWYILVDDNTELYALSTSYLNQSFDKNALPCGLVITDTGSKYFENGQSGTVCGLDWFNYPKEAKHIRDVYPEIWEWLTSDKKYRFEDIYHQDNIPEKAFPASDLGLYRVTDADMCMGKDLQN